MQEGQEYNLGDFKGDILGALAGGAVALPQSMGLGIVLFSTMGFGNATGAVAGLIGATILLIISGAIGATRGMISAPNGPMTMLLVGVMAQLSSQNFSSEMMLITLGAILITTGIFQIIIALLGGAKLIKYIPYPVVSALITGVGLLMIKSQIELIFGKEFRFPTNISEMFPFIVALISIVLMVLSPKLTDGKIPGAIGALIGGSLMFFLLKWVLNIELNPDWVVGEIPSLFDMQFGFSLVQIESLPYEVIISSSLALTILGMTDCLVTALVADFKTKYKHNSTLEIVAQGIAEIFIGLSSGLGGWGTKGATLVAVEAGGRRFVAFFAGILFIILMTLATQIGELLPVAVLAGIVGMVGFGMIEWDILSWLRYRNRRRDGLIALTVIVTILSVNLVVAVGVGVILSILLFVVMQSKERIIHSRSTLSECRSSKKRAQKEREIIEKYGGKVVLYELKGNLFFATTDRFRERIAIDFDEAVAVILHFRRVNYLDLSAMMVILQLISIAKGKNCELIFCHLYKRVGFGKKVSKAFKHIKPNYKFKNRVFRATDKALEYAENILLKSVGVESANNNSLSMPVYANDFCSGLNSREIKIIYNSGVFRRLKKKNSLFKEGEFGDSIFLVLEGSVEIRLYSSKYIYKRLAIYTAGTHFGEVAFISPGKRSFSAIVTKDCVLFEITKESIIRSVKRYNRSEMESINEYELFSKILSKIAIKQSRELRDSTKEIARLELL